MKFNEEQHEAWQAEADARADRVKAALPDGAREKLDRLEELVGEIEELGVPYMMFCITPTGEGGYTVSCYNDSKRQLDHGEGVAAYTSTLFIHGLVSLIGAAEGELENKENPLAGFLNRIEMAFRAYHALIQLEGDPDLAIDAGARETLLEMKGRGEESLDEVWGMGG